MADMLRSPSMAKRVAAVVLAFALAATFAVIAPAHGASAAGGPSGERVLGQSTLEPVFNDVTGSVIYIKTPNNAPLNANPRAWAPIYIPVYPTSAAGSVGVMQCAHQPADNCPDHGPAIAAVVAKNFPEVYGNGVWGHDHLLAPPASGGDFNIAWEPILVIFTNSTSANTHVTTLSQINTLVQTNQAILVPLPQLTFHCEVVPAVVYQNGTPVKPV